MLVLGDNKVSFDVSCVAELVCLELVERLENRKKKLG
jgi:hypothetical protein